MNRDTIFLLSLLFSVVLFVYSFVQFRRTLKDNKRLYFWVSVILALGFINAILATIIGMRERGDIAQRTTFSNWVVGLNFTLIATLITSTAYFLFNDLGRLFSKIKNRKSRVKSTISSRRKFIGQLGVLVAGIPFTSFLYGVFKGRYDYTVLNQVIEYPDLPTSFDGLKILQISDVHAGSFDDLSKVQKGIDLMQAQGADIIVFTGDLVNSIYTEALQLIPMFSSLKAPLGKFSVLGNHDYGGYHHHTEPDGEEKHFEAIQQVHKDMGFRLLNNEARILARGEDKICLAGTENWGASRRFPKKADLDKTFESIPKGLFTVLLSHDPTFWDHDFTDTSNVVAHEKKVNLTLSGHTHGSQVGIEFPWLKWSPVQYIYKNWAGLYEKGIQKLYVNRGFGYIGFPGRVGIWPEITVFELKKG